MRSLPMPQQDPLAFYDAIVEYRREPRSSRLKALRERIACAYLRYYAHAPRLERLNPLGRRISTQEANDLVYCYDKSRAGSSAICERTYAAILKASLFCSYCGIGISHSSTLDHYLPKGGRCGYPEFAVLPVNLIPSCHRCNSPRDFRDEAGRRALVHPYFDEVPSHRLLFADVGLDGDLPTVEFRVDVTGSHGPFGALYERHVQHLGLLPQYNDRAMASELGLSEIQRNVRSFCAGKTAAEVSDILHSQAQGFAQSRGANHFLTALYYGAAASEPFVHYCLRGMS